GAQARHVDRALTLLESFGEPVDQDVGLVLALVAADRTEQLHDRLAATDQVLDLARELHRAFGRLSLHDRVELVIEPRARWCRWQWERRDLERERGARVAVELGGIDHGDDG